jgi:hypothetical protein
MKVLQLKLCENILKENDRLPGRECQAELSMFSYSPVENFRVFSWIVSSVRIYTQVKGVFPQEKAPLSTVLGELSTDGPIGWEVIPIFFNLFFKSYPPVYGSYPQKREGYPQFAGEELMVYLPQPP